MVALVQRDGDVRSFHVANVTGANLKPILKEMVSKDAHVMTDESSLYKGAKKDFAAHSSVNHKAKEYSRHENGITVTTNTVEGVFSILKRGVYGVYHHWSKEHLHRYLAEFDFRYNSRKLTDRDRAVLALKGIEGKRLMYRDSCGKVR